MSKPVTASAAELKHRLKSGVWQRTRTRVQEVTRHFASQVTAEVTVGLTVKAVSRLVQVVYLQVGPRLTRPVSHEMKACLYLAVVRKVTLQLARQMIVEVAIWLAPEVTPGVTPPVNFCARL